MPVLSRFTQPFRVVARDSGPEPESTRANVEAAQRWLLSTCANPRCTSGWLKAWRSRTTPVFEGGWCCSPACTEAQVSWALRREIEMMGQTQDAHRHRIPLGLVMMERGWITGTQLRGALQAQRAAGAGRVGHWLIHQQGVNEDLVTRALGLQWRCPVLSLDGHEPESVATFFPRLFVDAFGALPLRAVAGKLLYVGFEERLDLVLALAVERMTDMRVECGLVRDSLFRPAHSRMMQSKFPGVELIEAVSEQVLAQELARRIERVRPVDCKLVRVHDCFWMRLWKRPQRGPLPELAGVEDLICSLNTKL
jgi:hypothetical protein